jgi:hypothetical protein
MSVDWRWQRVLELDEADAKASRERDDYWVKRAHNYQKRKATLHVRTESRLAAAYPAIHTAFQIHMNTVTHFRWIIQAAVLANVDRKELAEFLALTPEIIEAYEMLFFDVRRKLKSRGYIIGSVIGPIVATGVNGNDPDGFWKILAFNGGWEHVQGCWDAGTATPKAMAFYKDVAVQQVILKAAASGLGVQPNSFNAVDIIRAGLERVQVEEDRGQAVGGDEHTASFQALIDNLHVTVENPRAKLGAVEERLALPAAKDTYATFDKDPSDK